MTELVLAPQLLTTALPHPFRSHWRLVAGSERLRESLNNEALKIVKLVILITDTLSLNVVGSPLLAF